MLMTKAELKRELAAAMHLVDMLIEERDKAKEYMEKRAGTCTDCKYDECSCMDSPCALTTILCNSRQKQMNKAEFVKACWMCGLLRKGEEVTHGTISR